MSDGSKSRFSRLFKWGGSNDPTTEAPASAAAVASHEQLRSLKQQGQLDQALASGLRLLTLRPDDMDAAVLVAEILTAQGQRDAAVAIYSKQIELGPGRALAWYKRGNLLKDAGRAQDAVADYDRAIALDPNYAYALCNRGVVLASLGRLDAALESYDRAIAVAPGDVIALFARADLLRELKRIEEALASYNHILTIQPDHLQSYCNRGVLLTELERYTEARADFDRALALSTNVADVYFGRGRLLQRQQQFEEALADYQRAALLDPSSAVKYHAQGEVFEALDRLQDAMASYDAALGRQPDYADAHMGRASVLVKVRRHMEAIHAYERALEFKPDTPFAIGLLQYARMLGCDWDGLDAGLERIAAGIRRGERAAIPFTLLAMFDDASLQYEGTRIYVQTPEPPKSSLPPLAPRPPSDKLRIGYFSCDFREHPVAMLTSELFESHDRSRFEITAFSLSFDDSSAARERLKKAFDRFIDVRHIKSDRDLALLAREHGIDIAVDLAGHTQGGRMGVFCQRAAPVQAAWLGFAGTTGADYFDYLIGDRTVIPVEHQPYYSEKIVYLPHCYLPNDSTRAIAECPTREQVGLPAQGFVFCSFNNSYKFTPAVFSSWMRILKRVEGSVLWLAQNNEPNVVKNLPREAENRGIDPRRIIFAGRTPGLPEHLARLQLADLFLDTLPYNAHSTAIDALWAGLPILTHLGNSFAGRVAASLLRAIELPELVTTGIQEYEELAVELGTNPARLDAIKQRLARNRLSTPLFDSRSFVRKLEAAYISMYERYRQGLPPGHIEVT